MCCWGVVLGCSQPKTTHSHRKFPLLPGSVINRCAKNANQGLPCDLVKVLEQRNMARRVDSSEEKGDFWQCQATSEENKLSVGVLEEGQQGSDVLDLLHLSFDFFCLKVSAAKWRPKQNYTFLLDQDQPFSKRILLLTMGRWTPNGRLWLSRGWNSGRRGQNKA